MRQAAPIAFPYSTSISLLGERLPHSSRTGIVSGRELDDMAKSSPNDQYVGVFMDRRRWDDAGGSGANLEMRLDRVFFRDRGLRVSRLRRVEELFAGRHFDLNDLEVFACQRGVAFGYLDIGVTNYFRR
jgi:hypothetical protein